MIHSLERLLCEESIESSLFLDNLNDIPEFQDLLTAYNRFDDQCKNVQRDSPDFLKCTHSTILQLSDEIIARIFGFLDVHTLTRVTRTSKRMKTIVDNSIQDRMPRNELTRRLAMNLENLRAEEQRKSILAPPNFTVRMPALLLPKRVWVTGCGSADANGIYYCTGVNGNGYVFTKATYKSDRFMSSSDPNAHRKVRHVQRIEKVYSSSTLLWYLSREVIEVETNETRSKVYQFWARLQTSQEAPEELNAYPSQTPVLEERGSGWQTLQTEGTIAPPNVFVIP